MATARRPISMRQAIRTSFASVERSLGNAARREADPDRRSFLEFIGDKLAELRDLSTTSAAEAPAVPPERIEDLIEQNDRDRTERILKRYILQELDALRIGGSKAPELAQDLIEGLRGPGKLSEIATAAIAGHPEIEAQEFCAHMAEGILREAIGLDGRVPDVTHDEDRAAVNAFILRMTLGCDSPHIRDGQPPRPAPETQDALENGEMPCPGMMGERFPLTVAHIAGDAFERIERLSGGRIPEAAQEAIYRAIEQAALQAGPRLSIEVGDATPEGSPGP